MRLIRQNVRLQERRKRSQRERKPRLLLLQLLPAQPQVRLRVPQVRRQLLHQLPLQPHRQQRPPQDLQPSDQLQDEPQQVSRLLIFQDFKSFRLQGPRNPITAPKPKPIFNQNPSSGDRNMNQQQIASGQRDSSGNLWCFTCSGGSFDECTKDENLRQCSKDQNFCMVELRTQPAQGGELRMVRKLSFDLDH